MTDDETTKLHPQVVQGVALRRPELIRAYAAQKKASPTIDEHNALIVLLADLVDYLDRIDAQRRELRFVVTETGHQAATHFERFIDKLERFAEPPSCSNCDGPLLTEIEVKKGVCGDCHKMQQSKGGCPHPARDGRHEWYLIPTRPGLVKHLCRACGATRLFEAKSDEDQS